MSMSFGIANFAETPISILKNGFFHYLQAAIFLFLSRTFCQSQLGIKDKTLLC
jgi:hypothetical protein